MITTATKSVGVESATKMFVTRCCGCKRYRNNEGEWVKLFVMPDNAVFTDGICVPCIKSRYPPEMVERILARMAARGLL